MRLTLIHVFAAVAVVAVLVVGGYYLQQELQAEQQRLRDARYQEDLRNRIHDPPKPRRTTKRTMKAEADARD